MLNFLSSSSFSVFSGRVSLRSVVLACVLALGAAAPAWAGLFDDDEARKAILELRQETADNRSAVATSSDQIGNLHRSLLDQQNQLEALRAELQQERGQREQLERKLTQLVAQQQDLIEKQQALVEKQKADEAQAAQLQQKLDNQAVSVSVDGVRFETTGAEKDAFDAAMMAYRAGDYNGAIMQLTDFEVRFPSSNYLPSVRMGQGNAYFVQKEYVSAMKFFREMVAKSPTHPSAPEAALSIASSQIALGKQVDAKKTLEDLIILYPDTEAAATAKQRLSGL